MDKPQDNSQGKPKTEQELAQEFIREHNALCERSGFTITDNPAFLKRDDGTYSLVIQHGVGRLPKKE